MRSCRVIALVTLALLVGNCANLPSRPNALAEQQGSLADYRPSSAQQASAEVNYPSLFATDRAGPDSRASARDAYAQAPLTLPPPGAPLPLPTGPAAPPPAASQPTGFLGMIFGRTRTSPAAPAAAAPVTSASIPAPVPAPAPAPAPIAPAFTSAPTPAEPAPAAQPTGFFAAVGGMFARRPASATPAPPSTPFTSATPAPAAASPPAAAMAQAPIITTDATAAVAAPAEPPYTLDTGDRLRVVVFGQDGLSNSYFVDAAGNVTIPLIGAVTARGHTTQELSRDVAERLRRGFIREPHVAIEVEVYRPFFILGEVTYPGQYPYVPNMTVETAVAIAGGFSPRAYRWEATLDRAAPGTLARARSAVPLFTRLRPGRHADHQGTLVLKPRPSLRRRAGRRRPLSFRAAPARSIGRSAPSGAA